MTSLVVRPPSQKDYAAWRPLWDGYNEFYGRHGPTALSEQITQVTWQRFFDPSEPVFALVADDHGQLVGLAHYLFHRVTIRTEQVCYLNDLFTLPSLRGKGVGRALIEAVCNEARAAGAARVYWQTHETNVAGRLLYDKAAKHHGFIVYSREPQAGAGCRARPNPSLERTTTGYAAWPFHGQQLNCPFQGQAAPPAAARSARTLGLTSNRGNKLAALRSSQPQRSALV